MTLVLTVGDWSGRAEYIAHLIHAGHMVAWSDPAVEPSTHTLALRPLGLVCALDSQNDVEAAAALARALGLPWLAWDCAAGASMDAYRMGAVAVVPADISPTDLVQAVGMFLKGADAISSGWASTYEPSEIIAVDADSVAVIISGIVAKRALHLGGSQSLMGLCGPGDVLLGHPSGPNYVELVAHSETQVSIHQWRDVALTGEYAELMRRSQTYLTAWASVQSRPRMDHRLLGVLMLLAERFGRHVEDGWVAIDVRLTHQQLAEAVCVSRPTVSKVLRDLLPMEAIRFSGTGDCRRVHFRPDLAREIISG